ncbi:MAG: enoyl-CoA hydratase [Aquincola sp.]|uniref:oxepin-CoA hydrolase, alternative type n=1 Tax=uncultured Aquincola sp. TaxID=886556 RepID=UPI0032B265ED|nr:enoyl-CoA hydratase [Aquincola sp.]
MSTAAQQDVLLQRREGAVLVLVNNNPAARNALSAEFYTAATHALADADADPTVGAIVLTGAGGFFCAGGNLNQLATRREMAPEDRRERLELLHTFVRRLRDTAKPVIAAVEGGAAGAGMSLALACDLLVSSREAFFGVSYIKVGLTPDGGITSFLAEFVSRQVLTELCLTGDRITAERLNALGAVNRLVEPGSAEAEAIALGQRIAEGPDRATARIKALCRGAHMRSLDEQLELEARAMVQSQGDDEAAEGIGAFLQKRRADFTALRRRG